MTGVGEGEVLMTCAADEAFSTPLGVVHGGLLCTLLDTAMGLALDTALFFRTNEAVKSGRRPSQEGLASELPRSL